MAVAPAGRDRRWAEWPLAAVLLGVGLGLLVVANNRFRLGTVIVAASVVLAMVLRAVLSQQRAGLLVVRSRLVDVLTLGVFGVGLTVLALIVPPPGAERSNGVGSDRSRSGEPAGITSAAGTVLMTRDLHRVRKAE